jgi:glycosyltransferase involved in cell wall biosynthesis
MAHTPVYSVVVPVFNSENSLLQLVSRLKKVFDEVIKDSFEVILVDDGSSHPGTWPVLERLACEEPFVVCIRLMRNYGKASAVLCGLNWAQGHWIITMDDDLQQAPEDIPKLITYRDHDVVVGQFRVKHHTTIQIVTSRIKSLFDRVILGVPCRMSPLKLITAKVAHSVRRTSTPNPFIPALLSAVTDDFVGVEVEHHPSFHGKSRYSLLARFKQFSNLLIGNSSIFLRGFAFLGLIISLIGLLFALYIVGRRLFGSMVLPGWSSLIVINLVFGGLILTALGLNGEYLVRILEETGSKPVYVIRYQLGPGKEANESAKGNP